MSLEIQCPDCRRRFPFPQGGTCECGKCLWAHATENFLNRGTLDQCPVCGCAHLHRKKDFDPKLGVGLVAVGVALSFFTYGLSLLAVTIIDWWLYRRVGEVGVCYLCDGRFRGETVALLPLFELVMHDHYRAVRANAV